MALVVDSADWKLDGKDPEEAVAAIERFLGCLSAAVQTKTKVWFGEDFQSQAVLGEEILWSLSRPESPIPLPQEAWHELAAHLGREENYTSDSQWPDGFPDFTDIAIADDPPTPNHDVAWVHHSIRAHRAAACIGLWRKGVHKTTSAVGAQDVHWVSDEASMAEFWRSAVDVEGNSPEAFERFAERAYPRLYFHDRVLHDVRDFDGGYHAIAPTLKNYLAVLNESGSWVFTAPPPSESPSDPPGVAGQNPTNQLIQRRLELLQLVVAPENPDVFKNEKCRRAREITINGKVLYCEWHCKLELHRNRVHIHGPESQSGDKLVIAIFATHLPLP